MALFKRATALFRPATLGMRQHMGAGGQVALFSDRSSFEDKEHAQESYYIKVRAAWTWWCSGRKKCSARAAARYS
jgi:hypothetical protein